MEIAALPVPAAFGGIVPEPRGNAHEAPRGQRAAALVKSGGGRGVPDEVILQGEVLRKEQYTYSKPKNNGSDLQGEAHREGHTKYAPPGTPTDAYTLRRAVNAYQEQAQVDTRRAGAPAHQIDVYV